MARHFCSGNLTFKTVAAAALGGLFDHPAGLLTAPLFLCLFSFLLNHHDSQYCARII
jgi:hypothetical protein